MQAVSEATTVLDIRHQQAVMATALALAARGASVVAVLHDLNLAAACATRIGVLSAGRLVACGAPSTVMREDLLTPVFGHPLRITSDPEHGCPVVLPARRTDPATYSRARV
jgi:iron complex transport system ATP-binding protein